MLLLVLELAARGTLREHVSAVSDHHCCPGLEEEACGYFGSWSAS